MSRSYRAHDCNDAVLDKVFNHGEGCLAMVFVDDASHRVYVNLSVARKRDFDNVRSVYPDYDMRAVEYGYPKWYAHSFAWVCRNEESRTIEA